MDKQHGLAPCHSKCPPCPRTPVHHVPRRYTSTASPDDGGTRHALQAEAVNADGARLPFATAGKRPSVRGSTFTHGARVFLARDGGPGVALCESVLDALAVVRSPWGAASGEAVIAAAGTSGLQAAAVRSWPGPVTIWAQEVLVQIGLSER